MRSLTRTLRSLIPILVLGALPQGLQPLPASAVPVKGFREDFPGTSVGDWGGGSLYENPGTGGTGGAGDGYLRMWTPTPFNLGTVNLAAPYPGDWVAGGIQFIKVSLNDVGADEAITIHFIFADGYTTFQYNPGFTPPHNQWQEYTVDLTNPGNWTRIIGTGSFASALAAVDRIHFRHDLPPYTHFPDVVQGDVGIDRLIFLNATTPAATTSWGRVKRLYRR